MKLFSYLDPNFIFLDLKSKEKDDVISEMVDKVSKKDAYFEKNREMIKEAVLKREHEISTAMGKKIAIPHARIENYKDVVLAIGILKDEICCELADHRTDNVKIFFLIVAGQVKNNLMLKLMSGIMKLVGKSSVMEKMPSQKEEEKIIELIREANIEVSERITAEDVMNKEVKPCHLDDNLEEIAKRFVVESLIGIPVVNDDGRFIGEITERELIQYGMPKYTSLMNDLSFMTIGEPFEEYFKNEKNITVKELYRKNPIIVDRKASIMEVSFLMVTKGNTRIYVVEDGKYFGMIYRSDIIKEVLHV